jgi:hypothetical protein
MTIDELRDYKTAMEARILDAITAFEAVTSARVSHVTVLDSLDANAGTRAVKTEVKL